MLHATISIKLEWKTSGPGILIKEKLSRKFDREKVKGSLDYGEIYHQDYLMAWLTFPL